MATPAIHELGVVALADAIAAGKVSAEEAVTAALDRASAAAGLNAVVGLEPDDALAAARALDIGRTPGALHGVPMAHKDMFDRAGKLCERGSLLDAGRIATTTSPLVARLEAAGAITIGRLHMAEFAMGPTGDNAHLGRCRNPWNGDRISGGSSSGSGAAVAAGIVPGALGSDTGGSVRLPAAFCGIVGLKPTNGRLSADGMMPLSKTMDTAGPLARSTRDVARMFDVLTGGTTEAGLDGRLGGVRIGVPTRYYVEDLDPEVGAALDAARYALARLGAVIVDVVLPDQQALLRLAEYIWAPEAAAVHGERLRERPQDYGEQVRNRLYAGASVTTEAYRQALLERGAACAAMLAGPFATCDVLLTPACRFRVPLAADVAASGGEALKRMIGDLSGLTRPASVLGFPALVTPMGYDRDAMPLALQLIGPPDSEALLMRTGDAYERVTSWVAGRPFPQFPARTGD